MKNPNELSATSSWRGNELQLIEQINGARGESFSLENLEKEIHKGFNLTFQELQMMSNQTITLQNI